MVPYGQQRSPNLEEVDLSWQMLQEREGVPIPIPEMQSLSADPSLMDTMYEVSAKLGLPINALKLALVQPKTNDKDIADIMEGLYPTIDQTFGKISQLKHNWNRQVGLFSLWIDEIYEEKGGHCPELLLHLGGACMCVLAWHRHILHSECKPAFEKQIAEKYDYLKHHENYVRFQHTFPQCQNIEYGMHGVWQAPF